jgi:hypothetical protein
MKSKVAILSLVSLLFTVAVLAQGIENDDMYFNSKDRAKLNASKTTEVSASIKTNKKATMADEAVNPTDSYSARNVNPEYQARSNSQTAQADNQDYFVNNYKYNNASNFNNWNNNFNNWYSNPWYGGNYYSPYINSFNSPYYGSRYDMWGSPWSNPYYQSGWSSSFSYYMGNSYNYGWGMNFGYGNYGYNPYNAWAGWGSPFYYGASLFYGGYGSPYGYGYPTQVVVVESGYHGPVYGKRASRSTQLSGDNGRISRAYNRQAAETSTSTSTNVRPTIGGRTSSYANTQSDYYNRGWRNQTQNSSSSYGYPNSNSGNSNTRSSWESNTRSSWNESNSGNTSRSYDTGRSSGSSYSGGSSSGSSSTGSRSSGRGH